MRLERDHDKRSETIPSSRITPDPLDSQLHDGASSLQFPAPWRCCFSSVPSSMTVLLLFSSQLHDGASSLQFPAPWRCFFSSVPSSMTVLLLFSSQLHDGASSLQFPAPWRCFFSSVPSSMTVLLLFSSQLHDGAASLQFTHSSSTGFRSEDWNGQQNLVLCSVTHFSVVFEVCVWIIVRLEDPNMAHYTISNRVGHLLIFYLLVFDRIHDAMHLNKMSRTSSRHIDPQHCF